MRIDVLKNFLMLAEEKNMTRAARSLHIAQPTLSRQMSALEDELGYQLYMREDGTIKLTSQGAILRDYAQSIVDLEQRARTDIANADAELSGSVYIGYGDSNAMQFVFQAISDVRELHPGIEFNLISGATHALLEHLGQGSIDFALECGVRPRGRYHTLEFPGSDSVAAIVGRKNPLFGRDQAAPADLVGQPLVVSRQFFEGAAFRAWAGASYANMDVAAYFNLGTAVFDLAAYGTGCILGYRELAERYFGDQIACIPLAPVLSDQAGLVWRKDRSLSPAATAFLQALERVVEQAG